MSEHRQLSPQMKRVVKGTVLGLVGTVIVLTGLGVYFHHALVRGTELGSASLSAKPSTLDLGVPEGQTRLHFWSDYRIEGPAARLNTKRQRHGLPASPIYAIEVSRDGRSLGQLRCDALIGPARDGYAVSRGISDVTVESRLQLADCSIELAQAGPVQIEARLVSLPKIASVRFVKTGLVVMAYAPK